MALHDETLIGDQPKSYKWTVLLITTIGSFMTPLDGSIVSIAIPSIASELRIDFATAVWIPTIYLLSIAMLLLSFGRLSDIKGRKSLFISGFAVFTVASALCGTSQTGVQLLLFRALQGAGGALMGVNAPAIVTDIFPSNERGKALGINAMAVYIGLSVGPSLGGFFVQSFGWRSIFYVNVPIGVAVILLSLMKLRESTRHPGHNRFDLLGATAFSVGLAALLLALTLGEDYGWGSLPIVSLFSVSGISLASFIAVERKMGEDAMLDTSLLFHNRLFAAANASTLLNYISLYAVTFFMSLYLQRVLDYPPVYAGMTLLSMPLTMAILSPISGWLSDRFGSRLLASLGMGIICVGLLFSTTLDLQSSSADVLIRLFVIGFGMGLFASPNTSAVMGSVEKERLGVASGTLATMRFVGQSTSLALMGAVISTVVPPEVLSLLLSGIGNAGTSSTGAAFVDGIHRAFLLSAAISALGLITSLVRGDGKGTTKEQRSTAHALQKGPDVAP